MRNLMHPAINRFRMTGDEVIALYGSVGDETCGRFMIPKGFSKVVNYRTVVFSVDTLVIASSGESWDHVSASNISSTPSWAEMSALHALFFKPDEVAYQLHVPSKQHINLHPHVLHIWRPLNGTILLPPTEFV